MRIFLITLFLSLSISGIAQDQGTAELETKLNRLKSQNRMLSGRISELESNMFSLRKATSQAKEEMKSEIRKSQELQAQNERAMNIALDEFSKKFEEQNKTVAGVREELADKFSRQLMFFGIGGIALIVVFVMVNKASTNRALSQNDANWNKFQEHLLKK